VLQNKKYIKHSEDNTVEVIALGSLKKAIDAADRKAATYPVKGPDGKTVEYMVEYPNLTAAQMMALDQGPARQYNKSGAIPYTSIVDPFTLKELKSQKGGYSSKSMIEWSEEVKKQLWKEHGKPKVTRKDLGKVADAVAKSEKALAKDDYKKALAELSKVAKKAQEWPDAARKPLASQEEKILAKAETWLQEAEAKIGSDAKTAARELGRIASKLKGTTIGEKAAKLLEELKAKGN
jgi:hypothetical protein